MWSAAKPRSRHDRSMPVAHHIADRHIYPAEEGGVVSVIGLFQRPRRAVEDPHLRFSSKSGTRHNDALAIDFAGRHGYAVGERWVVGEETKMFQAGGTVKD